MAEGLAGRRGYEVEGFTYRHIRGEGVSFVHYEHLATVPGNEEVTQPEPAAIVAPPSPEELAQ